MAADQHANRPAGETSPYLLQYAHNPVSGSSRGHELAGEAPSSTTPSLGSSGVYRIICVPTGKFYIGSAVDLAKRWDQHRRALRRGKHANRYLQKDWIRYGEGSFEFSVLEYVSPADLLRAEQAWMDRTGCADRPTGFNISHVAGSPGPKDAQVWEGFVDPGGNEITITNLHAFCRQHGFDYPSMFRLAAGGSKLKSYKGWTHRNSRRQREYVKTYEGFIDPEGRVVGPITNLAAFCRERGLDKTHMVAVAHGRICSHRGWTHADGRRKYSPLLTHIGFVNPEGQRVIITNLQKFCREHGLHPVRMRGLKSGQRKSYRGWTWRREDE
jgi:group I intron endonuclease